MLCLLLFFLLLFLTVSIIASVILIPSLIFNSVVYYFCHSPSVSHFSPCLLLPSGILSPSLIFHSVYSNNTSVILIPSFIISSVILVIYSVYHYTCNSLSYFRILTNCLVFSARLFAQLFGFCYSLKHKKIYKTDFFKIVVF